MNIKLYSENRGQLSLADDYTNPPENLIFPGSELKVSQSDEHGYWYMFQQFKIKFFTIRFCFFSSVEKDLLTVVTDAPAITFRLGISHSHQVITKELGKQVYHERGYNIFYEPDCAAQYPMQGFDRFIFIDFLLTTDYSNYLAVYHAPVMEEFMAKIEKGLATRLFLHSQVSPLQAWKWEENLQDWCYEQNSDDDLGLFIGNNLIENSIRAPKPAPAIRGITLSLNEVNRICDAAEIIRSSDKNFTVQALAKKIGISEHKLDAGFKEVFGHPVLKHKFEEKMLFALRLIDCQDSNLEKVASLLGYKEANSFSRDFMERFGYAPFNDKAKVK